ncbi:hypothetical protein AA313_de0204747 [Arthrobotrys entomopaga]|nr:hypothetical protein AA313_de0204747 [Arthrobotrys entomopaga]
MASATDIITYVGVPLAVLGVMPVLYTFVIAIITQQRVRRELRRNHIDAITRTSLMSGTVEVEHPRYSIQPLQRGDANYWKRSQERSGIRGGTWTIFHWHKIITGRVNYHLGLRDRMAQPQAEVDFEKLVTFLLDRGAVPDAEGVKLLKTMGLQTPRMTRLLTTSGPAKRSVLVVSNPEEAEGHLSLSIFWADELSSRNEGSLPPYWARLQPGEILLEKAPEPNETEKPKNEITAAEAPATTSETSEKPIELQSEELSPGETKAPPPPFRALNTVGAWDPNSGLNLNTRLPVRLYLGETGLEDARIETLDGSDVYGAFKYDHLKFQYPGGTSNMNLWFAAAAITTIGEEHKGLWKYAIPLSVVRFAQKDTMPHGALVWLGLVEEEETPMMIARKEAKVQAYHDQRHADFLNGIKQRELEKNMPEAMRKQAERQRMMAQSQAMLQRRRDEEREKQEEEFQKKERALTSHRITQAYVSNACITWLKKENLTPTRATVQETCEEILYKMLFEEEFADRICKMLDGWKGWGEIGVMNDRHLDEMKANVAAFCFAGVLLGVIAERANRAETWAGSDLAECQKAFRNVYLG